MSSTLLPFLAIVIAAALARALAPRYLPPQLLACHPPRPTHPTAGRRTLGLLLYYPPPPHPAGLALSPALPEQIRNLLHR
jgi:hypothetical protein